MPISIKRQPLLAIALPVSLALSLASCATETHLTDVDPAAGNPALVVSDVAVNATDYQSALTPAGGRVSKLNILGWVVMPRSKYTALVTAGGGGMDAVFDVFARECRADKTPDGCNARASRVIDGMMKR